jgi:hypothetical protein
LRNKEKKRRKIIMKRRRKKKKSRRRTNVQRRKRKEKRDRRNEETRKCAFDFVGSLGSIFLNSYIWNRREKFRNITLQISHPPLSKSSQIHF